MIRRRVLDGVLKRLDLSPSEIDDLYVMSSEIGTNAVVHGTDAQGTHKVHVVADLTLSGRIRVEVTDPGVAPVRLARDRSAAEGGRGLFMVSRLAADYGLHRNTVTRTRTGWFEMDIAALQPEGDEEPAPATTSTQEAARPVNTVVLDARLRAARPAVTVGTIGPQPLRAA
ncbi:ATP-binding protein [Kitasatospora sp. NPDC059817]|uniref:ATP-binding protein n=1 Tax=Kitasatospora sp. NPDC059817 TaxID=3346961 RepID=UPI0036520F2F